MKILTQTILISIVIYILLLFNSCEEKETKEVVPIEETPELVEKDIDAKLGGTVTTSEDVQLIIPANAFLESGEAYFVFLSSICENVALKAI